MKKKNKLSIYFRDHWPARTTPIPCIIIIIYSACIISSDAKKNPVGSDVLASISIETRSYIILQFHYQHTGIEIRRNCKSFSSRLYICSSTNFPIAWYRLWLSSLWGYTSNSNGRPFSTETSLPWSISMIN